MKMNKMMAASAAVAALVVGAPAVAQDAAEAASTGSENESYSEVYDVYDSTVENDLIDATLGSTVGDVNSNNSYDYDYVVSTQTLISANANQNFEEMIDVDTYEDYIELSTGDNYIDGSAFTAFAGIANLSLNTGVNSHAQSGTSIAAQGTVSLGAAPAAAGGE